MKILTSWGGSSVHKYRTVGEGHLFIYFDTWWRAILTSISNSGRWSPFYKWFSHVFFFQCAISNIFSNMVDILNATLSVSGMQFQKFSPTMVDNLNAILAISDFQFLKFSPTIMDNLNVILVVSGMQFSKFSPTMVDNLNATVSGMQFKWNFRNFQTYFRHAISKNSLQVFCNF